MKTTTNRKKINHFTHSYSNSTAFLATTITATSHHTNSTSALLHWDFQQRLQWIYCLWTHILKQPRYFPHTPFAPHQFLLQSVVRKKPNPNCSWGTYPGHRQVPALWRRELSTPSSIHCPSQPPDPRHCAALTYYFHSKPTTSEV